MPVMTGIECCMELRQMEERGDIPRIKTVMISGDTFSSQQLDNLKTIFNEVLGKPISKLDLFYCLDNL